MKKTLLITAIVILVACVACAWIRSRPPGCPVFAAATSDEWTAQAIAYLKEFKPSLLTHRARFKVYDDGEGWYEFPGAGLAEFSDGSWVYVIAHSHHDQDGAPVMNAVLAVDDTGQIFRSDAHPCGGFAVSSPWGNRFASVNEFLSAEPNLGHSGWKKTGIPNKVLDATSL